MFQATHLNDFHMPGLLPGVAINTTPTDYRPIKQFTLRRFDGPTWVPFGEMVEVSQAN
jgi:branched-chain amino acid transport system substrate-binding protein